MHHLCCYIHSDKKNGEKEERGMFIFKRGQYSLAVGGLEMNVVMVKRLPEYQAQLHLGFDFTTRPTMRGNCDFFLLEFNVFLLTHV